jgi:S1-C subfamily serine protease
MSRAGAGRNPAIRPGPPLPNRAMAEPLAAGDPLPICCGKGNVMSDPRPDVLRELSQALAARAAAGKGFVARLAAPHSRPLTATLWRADVAIASEQVFPKAEEAELTLPDDRTVPARVAGRDPGTNILALRYEGGAEIAPPPAAEPSLGALALVLAAEAGGLPSARLTTVRALGPAWHSLGGGRIDRRIALDLALSRGEEGGPVFDAAGGLLGMSTAGPRGRALVIPAATIERVLVPLVAAGRIERGWLGVALHPVTLPDTIAAAAGQDRGLIVLRLSPEGPAAQAGLLVGDILVAVGDTPAFHPAEIARRLGPDSIGQTVALKLVRAGTVMSLGAVVTARPPR